ncbi:hypothetical protein [Chryseobacterium sp. SORGH_AS_0447]|uniref:hypothetical protein n=1 Tax=Chryseobacterium sp. SORGH_AS_0447 TaxID=3041769 RepID=UPI0027D79A15|nr:hypothetical protein [Chryseobacterium sp. SORGH_AS_0447]
MVPKGKPIPFEDKNHYAFSLTSKDFFIIQSQEQMDEIFSIIHQHNSGNRFSPIPAVIENETYLIIKPRLKNTNDVAIESVIVDKDILYITVTPFDNPNFSKKSRLSPNILLKLTGNVSFKKVTIK